MMFRVNGISIGITEFDDINSLRAKAIAAAETLPEYALVSFPQTKEELSGADIKLFDFIAAVRSEKDYSFKQFINKYSSEIREKNISTINLFILFVSTAALRLPPEMKPFVSLELDIEAKELGLDVYVDGIIRDAKSFFASLEKRIENYKTAAEEFSRMAAEFENAPPLFMSDIIVDKTEFEIVFKPPADITSLEDLYNTIETTPYCPVAMFDGMFKFNRESKLMIPSEAITGDSIQILTLNNRVLKESFLSDYSKFSFSKIKIDGAGNIIMNIYHSGNQISQDERIQRILAAFHIELMEVSRRALFSYGTIFVPGLIMNPYIFIDSIMNVKNISYFLTCNENVKTLKNKYSIFTHFLKYTDEQVPVIFTPAIVQRNDVVTKLLPPAIVLEHFPISSNYVKMRIKLKKEFSLDKFLSIIPKILSVFSQVEPDIYRDYNETIPQFEKRFDPTSRIVVRRRYLKDFEKNIFLPGYVKKCQPVRPKILLNEEDKEKWAAAGKSMLEFPLNDPEYKTNTYICDDEKYSYVGVIENKLANRARFPYLPCCFQLPQDNKKNYINYMQGRAAIQSNLARGYVFITGKFVEMHNYGTLPPFIDSLMNIYSRQNTTFYRTGVSPGPNSFIEAVYRALTNDTKELKRNFFRDVRRSIVDKIPLVVCAQQMYDYIFPKGKFSLDEVRKQILSDELFFDPQKFAPLLEDFFDCRIILFTRNVDSPVGDFLLPRYQSVYCRRTYRKNIPCVFIYEHFGTSMNEDPRCEYITNKVASSFPSDDAFAKSVIQEYETRFEFFMTKYIIEPADLDEENISRQYIDEFGKAQALELNGAGKMFVFIDPIHPLRLRSPPIQFEEFSDYKTPDNVLIKYLSAGIIKVYRQYIGSNGRVYRFDVKINNVFGFVIVDLAPSQVAIETVREDLLDIFTAADRTSRLEETMYNDRRARYLNEFAVYKFSSFAAGQDINDYTVDQFGIEKFEISDKIPPQHKLSRFVSDLAADFESGSGKLICSELEKQNILYFLKVLIARNMIEYIQSYSARATIHNYFLKLTDYTQYPQVFVKGYETYLNIITYTIGISRRIFSEVQPDKKTYFFSNPNVDEGQIYCAQLSEDLRRALTVSKIWAERKYNIASSLYEDDNIFDEERLEAFTIYNYADFSEYSVEGIENNLGIKLIGFKTAAGEINFVSLLKLEDS